MASIAQTNLFSWEKIDASSDLDRLEVILSVLPDEELMRALELQRGHGRDDYPVRAIWNSIIAGVVFQHISIESLRRELQRNGELRALCGFNPLPGSAAVPPSWVYTRFLKNLMAEMEGIRGMFDHLVELVREELPDLGQNIAGDSKALPSLGKATDKDADGRRETDADWGKKKYSGKRADGSLWKKVTSWFGFKVHLLVDATYELPLAFGVTRASVNDTTQVIPLLASLKEKHEQLVKESDYLTLDRGYDSAENNREIYDEYGIKALIDIRHDWKDGEKTRLVDPEGLDRIVYDEDGTIFCVHQSAHNARKIEVSPMYFDGFEASRKTLKYRCPAAVYGIDCPQRSECSCTPYGRVVRIPLERDRRHFVPVPRATLKWERMYASRTTVERVNSRLDVSFMFENHYIRGQSKMEFRIGIALVIMLALALGAIKAGAQDQMRSLVRKLPDIRAA